MDPFTLAADGDLALRLADHFARIKKEIEAEEAGAS
jgi:hypothetical protein